jgi:preprotein translocase SecE subunit
MASVVNDKDKSMATDVIASGVDEPDDEKPRSPGPNRPASSKGDGFFTVYKKGQGYWTRIGTVAAAGLIAVYTALFLYNEIYPLSPHGALISVAAFIAGFALIFYYITNRPYVVDFLIATDSEMKKVNWTTKAELIGSTKIVIIFILIIMLYLLLCDTVFGYLFYWLHVLKVSPFGS